MTSQYLFSLFDDGEEYQKISCCHSGYCEKRQDMTPRRTVPIEMKLRKSEDNQSQRRFRQLA
jgi:hypothetical protein